MRRQWFRNDDGTFYRNSILVDREIRALSLAPWNRKRRQRLQAEWDRIFWHGVDHKDKLDRGDVEVKARPFREAYPNHPGLWRLDERRTGQGGGE